jgi:Flp pilus assembly protein protease CpaA
LALAILFLRTVVSDGVAARVKTLRPRAGIPYGIAIAAGTLLAITVSRV